MPMRMRVKVLGPFSPRHMFMSERREEERQVFLITRHTVNNCLWPFNVPQCAKFLPFAGEKMSAAQSAGCNVFAQ